MQVKWYGQSALRRTARPRTPVIDPFADLCGLAARPGVIARSVSDIPLTG
jgi:hypothetical protein